MLTYFAIVLIDWRFIGELTPANLNSNCSGHVSHVIIIETVISAKSCKRAQTSSHKILFFINTWILLKVSEAHLTGEDWLKEKTDNNKQGLVILMMLPQARRSPLILKQLHHNRIVQGDTMWSEHLVSNQPRHRPVECPSSNTCFIWTKCLRIRVIQTAKPKNKW